MRFVFENSEPFSPGRPPDPRGTVSGRLFSGLMAAFSLDHLCSVGPLACGWTTVFREPGGPTEHKWSNRKQVVQADRPRHDIRDAVPPCETIGGVEQGRGAGPTPPPPGPPGSRVLTTRASRTVPDDRPADPAAPDSPNTPGGDSSGSSRPAPLPRAQRPQRSLTSHPANAFRRPEQPSGRGRIIRAGRQQPSRFTPSKPPSE